MRTGPKPKSPATHALAGNPGKRPLAADVQPAAGCPEPPAHLSASALEEWRRVTAELAAVGLLARADRAALAAYCVLWSRWVQAEEVLEAEGPVVKTANGNLVQSPWLWVANKALDQLRHYAALFGLSPAARSGLRVPPPAPEKDPLSEYIGGS